MRSTPTDAQKVQNMGKLKKMLADGLIGRIASYRSKGSDVEREYANGARVCGGYEFEEARNAGYWSSLRRVMGGRINRRQVLRASIFTLVAAAVPMAAHAKGQDYTTYRTWSEVVEGTGAKYANVKRVADPGTSDKPAYTGFWFFGIEQFIRGINLEVKVWQRSARVERVTFLRERRRCHCDVFVGHRRNHVAGNAVVRRPRRRRRRWRSRGLVAGRRLAANVVRRPRHAAHAQRKEESPPTHDMHLRVHPRPLSRTRGVQGDRHRSVCAEAVVRNVSAVKMATLGRAHADPRGKCLGA